MKYIVYLHINKINQEKYIGITNQIPEYRWGKEGKGYKNQPKFYNAILKYGWNNFEHLILETDLSENEALELETQYIMEYNSIENGYNILLKGISSFPRYKPIYCITLNKKYNSIKEAAQENNIRSSEIIENCKGRRGPVKGLQWAYWNEERNTYEEPIPFKPLPQKTTPIFCIELNKKYESIASAARELSLDNSSLQKVLSGKRNGVKGLHFVRCNELYKIPQVIKLRTGKTRKIYCKTLNIVYESALEAAKSHGVTAQSIMKVCQKKLKTCNGLEFCYFDELEIEEILKFYGIENFSKLLNAEEDNDE